MLVFYHDYHMAAESKNVRRAMNKMGDELFPIYMEIHFADTLAQSDYMRRENWKTSEESGYAMKKYWRRSKVFR